MCAHVCLYVLVCACMCACIYAYLCVWLRICVLFRLCGLSQNIEFHGQAIPWPVGIACCAIHADNVDGKSPLFCAFAYHLHIARMHSLRAGSGPRTCYIRPSEDRRMLKKYKKPLLNDKDFPKCKLEQLKNMYN